MYYGLLRSFLCVMVFSSCLFCVYGLFSVSFMVFSGLFYVLWSFHHVYSMFMVFQCKLNDDGTCERQRAVDACVTTSGNKVEHERCRTDSLPETQAKCAAEECPMWRYHEWAPVSALKLCRAIFFSFFFFLRDFIFKKTLFEKLQ